MRSHQVLMMLAALSVAAAPAASQVAPQGKPKKAKHADSLGFAVATPDSAPIFTSALPVSLTLTANFGQLKHDRGDNPPWRPATVSYGGAGGAPVTVPLRVRTRGIWRLHNCDLPPLRLDFEKGERKHTIFAKLSKVKLVVHCRDNDRYERYVLQEFQLYRVYNVLTPMSHRVRLVHVAYVDSASGKALATRYAILQEEPAGLARRVGGILMRDKGAGPDDLDALQQTVFSLFQYLIGNTDWSISALHNVELVEKDTSIIPIAHDFDFSGVINTTYATPDPRLGIVSVRQRLYRGYCVDPSVYPRAFAIFEQRKPAIYALYSDSLGMLLDRGDAKQTLDYFDDFYREISDVPRAARDFDRVCLGRR